MATESRFNWFSSTQMGAEQMTGIKDSEGQFLKVLDSVLITGVNPQSVSSATNTADSAKLTYDVDHGYEVGQLVLVAGATDDNLNGRHRVIAKTELTITIDAIDVAVLTGTITTKVAPLGWQSIFGDSTPLKRAYRSLKPTSTKSVLFLDMSYPTGHGYNSTNPAKRVMVDVCENMTVLGTQINSFTSAFNNRPAIRNGKMFWYQCRDTAKNTAVTAGEQRNWVVVGNDACFFIFNDWKASVNAYPQRDTYFFGDMLDLSGATSIRNCGWTGTILANDVGDLYGPTVGGYMGGNPNEMDKAKGLMMKSADGTGTVSPFVMSVDGGQTIISSGAEGDMYKEDVPNASSQGLLGLPVYTYTSEYLRALIPAMYCIPQHLVANEADFDKRVFDNTLIVGVESNYTLGFLAFDLG